MKNIYEVQSINKTKSALVVVFFVVFVFLATYILAEAFGVYIGYEPSVLGFVGIALIISGTTSFFGYYFSDKIVLGISGARLANKEEDKIYTQVVENLCIGAGLPKPRLYVINDGAPNAFATGRNPENAVICVTLGLLRKLNRTELEGVLAHELTHIKNYDMRLMSVVSVMVGLVALLGDWFLRAGMGRTGRRSGSNSSGSLIIILGIVFAILSPIVAQLIQLAISRRREFMADAGSVAITRQPQGLVSALEKISADHEPLEVANKATAHLYIINPFKDKGNKNIANFAGLFNTHPPISERIKILREMV